MQIKIGVFWVSENWGVYITNINERVAYVRLDVGIKESVPIKEAGTLVKVIMRMKPFLFLKDRKLDLNLMGTIEEDIMEHIPESSSHFFVGVITFKNKKTIYYYTSNAAALQKALEHILARYRKVDFEIKQKDDQGWDFYNNYLYPDPYEEQWMHNDRLLRLLEKNGDDLKTPRKTSHWFYFKSVQDRNQFQEIIAKEGFDILVTEEVEGDLPYQLQVERIDKVDYNSINELTSFLVKHALDNKGQYDGWETQVIKK